MNVTIGPVRVCYLNAFEPNKKYGSYQVTPLIPMDNTALLKKVNEAIQKTIVEGVDKGTFPKAWVPRLKLPLRNGTEEVKIGKKGPEFDGHMFLNANRSETKGAPGILGPDKMPLMDSSKLYSGCWCYVSLSLFPFNTDGNAGVGAGFEHIMLVKEDTRLDGRISADQAFADIQPEQIEESGDLT